MLRDFYARVARKERGHLSAAGGTSAETVAYRPSRKYEKGGCCENPIRISITSNIRIEFFGGCYQIASQLEG